MQPTAPSTDGQRLRASLDSIGVFDLLADERFFEVLSANLPEHRERTYTPTRTLAMFVCQVLSDDRSLQRAVDEHLARCAAHGLPVPSSSTAAYSAARRRLPMALVTALCLEVARVARHTCSAIDHERPTYLVDGFGFSMPDTPDNQAGFPQSTSQMQGCGFPQGRTVALVCAATGVIVDTVVSAAKGKGTGESTAMREMSTRIAPGSLIVGDAVYDSFTTWAPLVRGGCDAVFELGGSRHLPRRMSTRLRIERGKRPAWMTSEEHAALPEGIELRVVVSRRRRCRDKILLTSILDERAWPDVRIVALYDRRWDVESDFKSFKDTLGAGVLGCRTQEMVRKELMVHVLGYNLVRLLMSEAAEAAECEVRQISFRHTQQCWAAWVRARAPLDEQGWHTLLARIAQRRVRNRPGRREPRARKRRPKSSALLDLPRELARTVCHAYERKGR